MKLLEEPLKAVIFPRIDLESPKYVRRYVPLGVPGSMVQEMFTLLVPRSCKGCQSSSSVINITRTSLVRAHWYVVDG